MSKRLYRSTKDKVLAGVCGGLAEYFEVDGTLIRILWAIAFFMGGAGMFAYIVAAVIIPTRDGDSVIDIGSGSKSSGTSGTDTSKLLGMLLIGLGLVFFMKNWFFWFDLHRFWPLILVGAGAWILMKGLNRRQ